MKIWEQFYFYLLVCIGNFLNFTNSNFVDGRDRTDGKTADFGRDYLVGIFRDKSIFYLKGNCGEDAGMKRDFWGYPQYTQKLSTKKNPPSRVRRGGQRQEIGRAHV